MFLKKCFKNTIIITKYLLYKKSTIFTQFLRDLVKTQKDQTNKCKDTFSRKNEIHRLLIDMIDAINFIGQPKLLLNVELSKFPVWAYVIQGNIRRSTHLIIICIMYFWAHLVTLPILLYALYFIKNNVLHNRSCYVISRSSGLVGLCIMQQINKRIHETEANNKQVLSQFAHSWFNVWKFGKSFSKKKFKNP